MRRGLLVFVVAATVLGAAFARDEVRARDPDLLVEDLFVLLEVGVSDEQIVRHFDAVGWPKTVSDAQLERAARLGAGAVLRLRLLDRLRADQRSSALADAYETFDGDIGGPRYTVLRPRGWIVQVSEAKGHRVAFHEHELEGWFRRTSFFLWFFEAGSWSEENASALARVVFDAARERLRTGGVTPGAASEEVLVDLRTSREMHAFSSVCTLERSGVRGIFMLAVRVHRATGRMSVMGFTARAGPDGGAARARAMLAEMLGSLKLVTP